MKEDRKDVVIIIPLYKSFLDDLEIKSLKSVSSHLRDFDIYLIAPESLNLDFLKNYDIQFNFKIQRFENHFFKSIDGYNELLLSSNFYKTFINYEFMLICQTDAFVFKNELPYWISQSYDYIGAPWLDSKNIFFRHKIRNLFNKLKKFFGLKYRLYNHINQVGNGGFSLRRIKMFYEIAKLETEQIHYFLKEKNKENYHIEDVFWSLYVPTKYSISKPDYKKALNFCVDRKPEIALAYLNEKLPFACHGFNKKGVINFWNKYI